MFDSKIVEGEVYQMSCFALNLMNNSASLFVSSSFYARKVFWVITSSGFWPLSSVMCSYPLLLRSTQVGHYLGLFFFACYKDPFRVKGGWTEEKNVG
jgi:hypothetical protein